MTITPCNWIELPPELMLHIFSYCKDKELGRLAQACKLFNSLAYDRTLNRSHHVRAFEQLTSGKYEKKTSFEGFLLTENQYRFIESRNGSFYEFIINSIPRTYQQRKLVYLEGQNPAFEPRLSTPTRLSSQTIEVNRQVKLILNDKSQPIAKEITTSKNVFRLDIEKKILYLNRVKLCDDVNDIGCLYGRALIATDTGVNIYDATTRQTTPLASKTYQLIAGDLNKALVYGLNDNKIEVLDFSSNKAESTLLDKPSVNLALRVLLYIKDKCIKFGIGFAEGAKATFSEMMIERKFYIVAGIISALPLILVPFSDITFLSALIFCLGSLALTAGLLLGLLVASGVLIGTLAVFEMWHP